MARASNRERILRAGLAILRERGAARASVRDIVEAAGVPQGSYTNHFASKEAFCLEVVELAVAPSKSMADRSCNGEDGAHTKRRSGSKRGGRPLQDGRPADAMVIRTACTTG